MGQIAAETPLHYLDTEHQHVLSQIIKIQRIQEEQAVWLDRFTMRNLELLESTHPTGISLLEVMDHCRSPMGSRMMRRRLSFPLTHMNGIIKIQHAVEELRAVDEVKHAIEECSTSIRASERLA